MVTTLGDAGLGVRALTAVPGAVIPGGTATVVATIDNPAGLALSYAWTTSDAAWSVTGAGATAVVTAPAARSAVCALTLTVTDAAGATAQGMLALVTTDAARPVAVIAGPAPLTGIVNIPVPLDGSGSQSSLPTGLVYNWSVTSAPAGATARFVDATNAANAHVAQPSFVADRAGSYGVQLQVIDTQDASASAFAITSVVLDGPTKLVIVSGDGQSGQVGTDLAQPLVVRATTASDVAVPSVGVGWDLVGGSAFTTTVTTNAAGEALLAVQLGRLAGDGSAKAVLNDDPTVTRTLAFHALAGPAVNIAVAGDVVTTDGTMNVTVRTVDQFGNPATDNAAANTAAFHLAVASPSGNARLVPAGGGPTNGLDAALAGGAYTITVTDTAVEQVSVTLSPRTTSGIAVLPFSAWTVEAYDTAELGFGANWTRTGAPPWHVAAAPEPAFAGAQAFGVALEPSEAVANVTTTLRRTAALVNPLAVVRADFRSHVQVASRYDQTAGCTAQPVLLVGRSNGATFTAKTPVGGYPVRDACAASGRQPSLATSDWVAQRVDLTDDLTGAPGNQYLAFTVQNPTPARNLAEAASWYVDDVRLSRFAPAAAFGNATANGLFLPGAATQVKFTAADFSSALPAYGSCLGGLNTVAVSAVIVDAHGNTTQDSQMIYRITWDGSALLQAPLVGTLEGIGPHQLELQFVAGQAQVVFSDTTAETLHFALQNTHAYPGIDSSSTAVGTVVNWVCHHAWGGGAAWSDGTALATFDATEADRACEEFARTQGYAGYSCGANVDYPNASFLTAGTNYLFAYGSGTVGVMQGFCRTVYDAGCMTSTQCPTYIAGQSLRANWNANCLSWRLCGGFNVCTSYSFWPTSSSTWQ
ncbi:MAG TPA: hypothetical protein VGQ83_31880 [Polyangia bacterium]